MSTKRTTTIVDETPSKKARRSLFPASKSAMTPSQSYLKSVETKRFVQSLTQTVIGTTGVNVHLTNIVAGTASNARVGNKSKAMKIEGKVHVASLSSFTPNFGQPVRCVLYIPKGNSTAASMDTLTAGTAVDTSQYWVLSDKLINTTASDPGFVWNFSHKFPNGINLEYASAAGQTKNLIYARIVGSSGANIVITGYSLLWFKDP